MAQNVKEREILEILWIIREGMPVIDCENFIVGHVKHVYLPRRPSAIVVVPPHAIFRLPEETQSQLAEAGFLHVHCGAFTPDCVVMPEQIAEYKDDGIHLNVPSDDLLLI